MGEGEFSQNERPLGWRCAKTRVNKGEGGGGGGGGGVGSKLGNLQRTYFLNVPIFALRMALLGAK